ncbi:MAG: hopanoid biosynthesis associated radical SAM protein HpnJ [Gammaproteobacteria bacterium]
MMKKTLFLSPPSFDGFDGGAGSRYQARREIRSFWFPTWLAQPAAMVPGSRLVDAPPRGTTVEEVVKMAGDYELVVMHTSTPSFANDARVAEAMKDANPRLQIGMVGAHVAVNPEPSLRASKAIDFVTGPEFDYTVQEIAQGRPLEEVDGVMFLRGGEMVKTRDRALIDNMDALPSVVDVYKRDLVIEDYFIGYLKHPYVSFYTGRGCRSHCTFCLWPQTIAGHTYRTRSPQVVADEVARVAREFPQVQEVFFDDDTFTDDRPRAQAVAKLLGPLGVTWSCNAKANVPYETLKILRDNGLRLLLVGYESGNQQILNNIRKGIRLDIARRFTEDCHKLGIKIHGTFIMGLPGETHETIEETIRYAREINPHTIQVSLAAAYPGTELYGQAGERGWLRRDDSHLVAGNGLQISSIEYPHMSHEEIFEALAMFYKRFYFRPGKIAEIVLEMAQSWDMTKRRLREGVEFFRFLRQRADAA